LHRHLFRRYQAIVWGSISGVILLALLVYLYLKMDNYDCKGPILYKYVLCWFVNDTVTANSVQFVELALDHKLFYTFPVLQVFK